MKKTLLCLLTSLLCIGFPLMAQSQSAIVDKTRLLLISNSTKAGEEFLDHPKAEIKAFLGEKRLTVLFIPYARVSTPYDAFEAAVKARFNEIGHDVTSIHRFVEPVKAVEEAQAIVVGGGNTWMLLHELHKNHLLEPVRNKIRSGTPYIGWSAGSNVASPTIKTTNDMPIIDPQGLHSFGLVPFQINPHYLDGKPEGFAGESREDRIKEFLLVNPDVYVVGLREQCMLWVENKTLRLIGTSPLRVFKKGHETRELGAGDDLGFLLTNWHREIC
jgi:dipeptidase E